LGGALGMRRVGKSVNRNAGMICTARRVYCNSDRARHLIIMHVRVNDVNYMNLATYVYPSIAKCYCREPGSGRVVNAWDNWGNRAESLTNSRAWEDIPSAT